jgi:cytoskeletal protein CcmA (bactofilin family)
MTMFEKHKSGKQETPVNPGSKASQPAPPSTPSSASPTSSKVALIGQGISIAGDVTADSNLKIEGRIEGRSVQSSHDIEVSESGTVTASIIAKVVKIAGEVTGDVGGSEKVIISRSGKVQGNVVAPRVQLEDGALFRGSIDMNPAESAAAKKPAPAKPVAAEKAPAAAPAQGKMAAAGSAQKEPGLNLKSG